MLGTDSSEPASPMAILRVARQMAAVERLPNEIPILLELLAHLELVRRLTIEELRNNLPANFDEPSPTPSIAEKIREKIQAQISGHRDIKRGPRAYWWQLTLDLTQTVRGVHCFC
jgi:hypothetical protein